jgi:hypothetical protein
MGNIGFGKKKRVNIANLGTGNDKQPKDSRFAVSTDEPFIS